jgi:hypothetical protein
LNFFAPALGLGCIASALAKLFWRSELKRVAWWRLAAVASGCAAAALVGGLVVLGHDGRLATYAAMVLATALSLWWFGFRPFRG